MVLRNAVYRHVRALVLLAALTTACASAGPAPPPAPPPTAEDLVWPPAPAEPHLVWAGSFALPKDLGLRSGMFRRVRRALIGGQGDEVVRPQGITVQSDTIYLTDPATARLLIYDRGAKKFQAMPADADHPWQIPTGVAATSAGRVLVADAAGGLWMLASVREPAERLTWPELKRPVAVAVDEARDRVYVLDTGRHLVCYGTADGVYQGAFGGRGTAPGQFNFPTHLTVAPDGTLYVTDAMNFRVQHLGPDGAPLSAFGQAGDGTGYFAKPKGVALDSHGTIYVVDALHDVVQLFDANGQFLMHVGGPGHQPGEFWLPTGIAIDATDHVYIADSYNRRVQILAPATREEPQ